jgi:glutamate racemase
VVAARATAESTRYEKLISDRRSKAEIVVAACPLWVSLVEEGWVSQRETVWIVKRCLRTMRARQVDTLILASSYFNPLRRVIQRKMGTQVILVEPSAAVATHVAEHLKRQGELLGQTGGGGRSGCWFQTLPRR